MPATRCAYCGHENAPGAEVCTGCGKGLFASETVGPHRRAEAQPNALSVVLCTLASSLDAQIAAKHLGDSGIPVVVNADDCGGLLPQLSIVGGYRLLVAEADLPLAQEALHEIEERFGLKAGASARDVGGLQVDRAPSKPKPYLVMLGLFLLGGVLGWLGHYAQALQRSYSGVDTRDFNDDGRADAWYTYRHGQCVEFSVDRNFDGKPDAWTFYQGGQALSAQEDGNFDGKLDLWITYSNEVVSSVRFDSDFDGKPDGETRWKFGLPNETIFLASNKLGYWKRDFWTNGVLRESVVDRNRDGTLDERVLFDPFGVILRVEQLK